jgi:pseudoazurin
MAPSRIAPWIPGLLLLLTSATGVAKEVEVKMLNRGPTGHFVFAPEIVRIAPGDTVNFLATDKGHEVHTVPGLVPQGGQPFQGRMNDDLRVTLTVPGVYVVACRPHTVTGMLAVIVVGDPVNLDKLDPSALYGKSRSKLEALLAELT